MWEGKMYVFYKGGGFIYSLRYNGSKISKGRVDRIFIISAWPVGNEQSIVW
jgi:hypothetical protein